MSASRERKKRVEVEQSPAAPKTKKKLSQGWVYAIVVIAVTVLVFGGMFAYRAAERNATVLTVGDYDLSVKNFNYYYATLVNNISGYKSYLGIDGSVALDEQKISTESVGYLGLFGLSTDYLSNVKNDGTTYDATWADLLVDVAQKNATSALAVYQEAKKAGYELDDETKADIEEEIETFKGYAKNNELSLNDFLARVYGEGCNEKSYREYLEITHIASAYPNSLTYSDEELDARYAESPETFDKATYYLYTVNASDYVESTTDEEGTTSTPEPTDTERDKANEAAEAFAEKFDEADEKVKANADQTQETVKSSSTEDAAKWLFETAKAGDVKLFASEDGNTYYVLKLIDKADYDTFDLLYFSMDKPSEGNTSDDAESETAEVSTAKKVEIYENSLKEDGSQENFAKLMLDNNAEASTEPVEAMGRASLASMDREILKWGAFETRKAGDWKKFETDSKIYFVYYVGTNAHTLRYYNVTNQLRTDWYNGVTEAAQAANGFDLDKAMKADIGRILGTSN